MKERRIAQKWPQMAPRRPKKAPSWPRDDPKTARDRFKMTPKRPEISLREPKSGLTGFQEGPTQLLDGSKKAQGRRKFLQNGFQRFPRPPFRHVEFPPPRLSLHIVRLNKQICSCCAGPSHSIEWLLELDINALMLNCRVFYLSITQILDTRL